MEYSNSLRVDENGFLLPGVEKIYISWSSIWRIRAFKKDLITFDETFISFECDSEPKYVEVSEEDLGFDEFRSYIEKLFLFRDGWWETVLKPPFESNEVELYVR